MDLSHTITFNYLPNLGVVTAEAGDPPGNELLTSLFKDDCGKDTPNMANKCLEDGCFVFDTKSTARPYRSGFLLIALAYTACRQAVLTAAVHVDLCAYACAYAHASVSTSVSVPAHAHVCLKVSVPVCAYVYACCVSMSLSLSVPMSVPVSLSLSVPTSVPVSVPVSMSMTMYVCLYSVAASLLDSSCILHG